MVVGGAPPFALVIVEAARVETQIAADGSHVAVGGPGDATGSLRHHGIMPPHAFMHVELGELDRGTDLQDARIGPDRAHLLHVVDIDEYRRGDDAAPDVDHEVGAAAQQPAVGMARAGVDHVLERCRPHKRKVRQRVH